MNMIISNFHKVFQLKKQILYILVYHFLQNLLFINLLQKIGTPHILLCNHWLMCVLFNIQTVYLKNMCR